MLKAIILTGLISASLLSCDVRNKDKQASLTNTDTTKMASAEPTTVQIIDSAYNFGKVIDGEIVEYSYRFKNVGKAPLVIATATASCGCTVPEKPEQPVLPGEIGFIKVKFNSEGRVGQAEKKVNVTSNASPDFPQLMLTGEVVAKAK
ncbi:MAG: hypothetical protein JWQ27_2294 [Ferruginibacter sp.]|nr:hypothetical protein [Ferruginibacter sp.]